MVARIIAVAGWPEGIDPATALALIASVAGGLALLFAILYFATRPRRRRLDRDTREIVSALEEMRSGATRRRVELETRSPLGLVSDAVERLRQEMDSRRQEARSVRERLEALQDAARDNAVVTTDTDGDIVSFNKGATEMFGWEQEEVVSQPASLLFDDRSYQEFLPKMARRALREKGIETRATMLRKDGAILTADLSVRMLHDASREPIGFVLVVRDVSGQARLEEDLRSAERRYRALVEGLADGVIIIRDGRVLYANPAFAALCGKEVREIEGTALRERVDTRDLLLVEERLEAVQSGGGVPETLRCRLLGSEDSAWYHVSLTATPIDYEGSAAVLLLVRDETQERTIEAELRRNEAHLDSVLESTVDGILALSDDREGGVVQMTNRAFSEMFGVGQRELLGLSLGGLLRLLEEKGGGARKVAAILAAGPTGKRERLVLGGASPREVEVWVAALTDRYGEPTGRMLACRDLTEERESQRKLQQHAEELQLGKVMLEQAYRRLDSVHRELQSRTEELDRLNRELRTLDEMKSNLLGNVSHELQTPLVSIRGYTEMILKGRLGPITEEQRKGLGLCLKNIDRLISMIDNLLAFTRSEPELGEVELSRFSLRAVIDEARRLMADDLRSRELRFSASVAPRDLEVHGDRDKVLQVFINLLSNAVKFNRQGGRVEIEARPGKAGFVDVRVEDTGVGIPREALDRIFERNYQVVADGGIGPEGSGIGLAIVRDILRLHGCRIGVESEEEHGTRFFFTLPLGANGSGTEARDEERRPPRTEPAQPEASPAESSSAEPSPGDRPGAGRDGEEPPSSPRPRFRVIRRYES